MESPAKLSRLVQIWAIGGILFAAAEGAARLYPAAAHLSDGSAQLLDYQYQKIRKLPEGAVVLVGDSSLGNAVDARVLSARLGRPAVNLALNGSFVTIGDYYLVRDVLASSSKPSALVIFHSPDVWRRPETTAATELLWNCYLPEHGHRLSLDKVADRLAEQFALVQQSGTYRATFLRPQYGLDYRPEVVDRIREFASQMTENDYLPQRPRLQFSENTDCPMPTFQESPFAREWLERTLALAERYGVPVYLANGPFYARRLELTPDYVTDLIRWQHDVLRPFPQASLLYEDVPRLPRKLVGDAEDHLIQGAKPLFTTWLAAQLQRHVEGRTPAIELLPLADEVRRQEPDVWFAWERDGTSLDFAELPSRELFRREPTRLAGAPQRKPRQ